jgi:hypothetical protein
MFGTLRTEICKVIGNLTKQSLTIINNYFLGLEAFSLYHVYIKGNGKCSILLLAKLDSAEVADP